MECRDTSLQNRRNCFAHKKNMPVMFCTLSSHRILGNLTYQMTVSDDVKLRRVPQRKRLLQTIFKLKSRAKKYCMQTVLGLTLKRIKNSSLRDFSFSSIAVKCNIWWPLPKATLDLIKRHCFSCIWEFGFNQF